MKKIIVAGIGPGSREDITSAVMEAVKEADAVVGYKYYFQFVEPYLREGCECIDTGMKKERERAEQAFLLAEQGKTVVVISSGISSFLAAAAELRSQFTIPERTQTIILTRGEGRTPMPEKEQLHLLARSQSTMCIFLSAAIVDDVQRELLQEYPEDTPVAACYHLTWPDQKIYRGVLKDLAKIVHDNHLTLTTMLVVGEAIDNRQGLSELYNKYFTHLFRQGEA